MVETGETVSPPKKRKRVVLSVKDKNDIVQRLNRGETVSQLSREYNIGMSTIYDVKKNSAAIINYLFIDKGCEQRKSMKKPANVELEHALLTWIVENKRHSDLLTGPVLCGKALELNKHLNGDPNFKASSGWLSNFKLRHNIREELKVEETGSKGNRDTISASGDGCNYHFVIKDEVLEHRMKKSQARIETNQTLPTPAPLNNNNNSNNKQSKQLKVEGNKLIIDTTPNCAEAMAAFDIGLRWLEKQTESSPILLMLLQNLHDLAQQKIENRTNEKQGSL